MTVETLQEESVVLRIFLWHHKRLFHFPIAEIGEIDTTELTILTTTGNHDPTSVTRLAGIAIRTTLVIQVCQIEERRRQLVLTIAYFIHRYTGDVAIIMSDMETAILS